MITENKKYIPPKREIRKAEKRMTPEEKQASRIRERFAFQTFNPFDNLILQIDVKDVTRRPPTDLEMKTMDDYLIKLGQLFEGSNVRWCLDGALNISLMVGRYIGIHKDIDISLEKDDMEKLDSILNQKGYGLFLSNKKDPGDPKSKDIMERVSASRFRNAQGSSEHLMIIAIDEQGKIKESDPAISRLKNFIDVHLVERNRNGNPVGPDGVNLPSKWFEPQVSEFHGTSINLSHPAKIAYYKIRDTRKYDMTDLKFLAEATKLDLEDIKDLARVLKQETKIRQKEIISLLKNIKEKIKPKMNANQIFQLFLEEPRIARYINQICERLRVLCGKIEDSDRSMKNMVQLTFDVFGVEKNTQERREKIEILKQWVTKACL